ncbi:MAG: flagellar hook-associated protein FlgK [Burkholderiaceae bacterium]
MGTNILNIGKTALNAAQVGLSTAGHNIANAATPGYNRQEVIQGTGVAQNLGFGFAGQGVEVKTIQRVYDQFLAAQVNASQTAKTALDTYYTQISRIDNVLADTAAGLSPALQGFFSSIQNLSAYPNMAESRQSALSSAQTLAARFQSLDAQLSASYEDVNGQITASVTSINAYASQIAQLNDRIQQASVGGQPPNDLLDQRDQLISELGKEVKVTVSKSGDSYNVSIGNGQSLVMGGQAFKLTTVSAVDDPARLQVGYVTASGSTVRLPEAYLGGGKLGGLFEFRSQSLDTARNELGRVAIGLAMNVNAQHVQGLDQNGQPGTALFAVGKPQVLAAAGNSNAMVGAAITDPKALTASDYRLEYDGTNYKLTRLADGRSTSYATLPQTVDGVEFSVASGAPAAGDSFLIRPTANGAREFKVLISDTTKLAAAGVPAVPVLSGVGSGNTGSGAIAVGGVDGSYAGNPLPAGSTLEFKYDLATNSFTVSPPTAVTVTVGGVATTYAAGDPVPYDDGAAINAHGIDFTISGSPADTDSFVLRPSNNVGDNANALKLAALQTANTLVGGTTSYQGAYSQLVSRIGNKTHELDVNRTAEGNLLATTQAQQQSLSGVNLDEEAANIMRLQQAYQAAAKMMQAASQMFDTLLSLGG